jgi:hypothetical protein
MCGSPLRLARRVSTRVTARVSQRAASVRHGDAARRASPGPEGARLCSCAPLPPRAAPAAGGTTVRRSCARPGHAIAVADAGGRQPETEAAQWRRWCWLFCQLRTHFVTQATTQAFLVRRRARRLSLSADTAALRCRGAARDGAGGDAAAGRGAGATAAGRAGTAGSHSSPAVPCGCRALGRGGERRQTLGPQAKGTAWPRRRAVQRLIAAYSCAAGGGRI